MNYFRRMSVLAVSFVWLVLVVSSMQAQETTIDSAWFNQEIDCSGEHIVEICYILSGDIGNIEVTASSDSGATWNAVMPSLFDHEGSIGNRIEPGEHCFFWNYGEDFPDTETGSWMVRVSLTSFLDTFIVLDSMDISARPRYGWGLGYGDDYFWAYDYNNGYVYKTECLFCPPADSFFIGRLYNVDIDYHDGVVYFASAGANPNVIEAIDVVTLERDTIAVMPIYYSGVQGVEIIGTDMYFSWYGTPPHAPRMLMRIDLTEPWPVTRWDTLLTSVDDTCETIEGFAYANGYLWSSNNFGRMVQIDIDVPEYTACYPVPNVGTGAEGLCFDGQYMWYMNNGTRKIYQIMIMDSASSYYIANAPLDSRPPEVTISCPPDTFVLGDTISISWAVEDKYPSSEPCSLIISYTEYAETLLVHGEEYQWAVPDHISSEYLVTFRIAARDSFCNWSSIECSAFVLPQWYASIGIGEHLGCAGDTILFPILIDPVERAGITSIEIEVTANSDQLIPINVVPDDAITDGWRIDFIDVDPEIAGIRFGISSATPIPAESVGNLVYIRAYIPEHAAGGAFGNIVIESALFNAGNPEVSTRNGLIALCVRPDMWIANLRFQSVSTPMEENILSIGAAYDATEGYDAGLDLIILPPTPFRVNAKLIIDDPEHPHANELRRDLRPVTPPQRWKVVTSGVEEGRVVWNPAVFPDGIFMLNGHINMKAVSESNFGLNDTLYIDWSLPDITVNSVDFETGWNLVSLPVLPAVNARSVFSFSPVNAFSFNPQSRSYFAVEDITAGMGMWVYSMADTTVSFAGYSLESYRMPVRRGWNMIGALNTAYPFEDITTEPAGIVVSGPYKYEPGGSYIEADILMPAKGYWILISEDGVISCPGD